MEVVFAVPSGSLEYWRERLGTHGARPAAEEERFGERVLPFRDPHGLALALVETDRVRPFVPWEQSTVPVAHQLRGMDAVRLWERSLDRTAAFLTETLDFERRGAERDWVRFSLTEGEAGIFVDVRELPTERVGAWGTGAVHHVAWRVRDAEEELGVRDRVDRAGRRPTPPIDRFWFTSVYFREPGGVLFELATDGPGFARDEDAARLGEQLILPPWLEDRRELIEEGLPPIALPMT
jgi:glyoxalase family protein